MSFRHLPSYDSASNSICSMRGYPDSRSWFQTDHSLASTTQKRKWEALSVTAAQAKRNHDEDEWCGQHGQFLSDIGWLKNYTKIILALVGTSAVALIGIFGTVVTFGMEMKVTSQIMQKELARLSGDVLELKDSDKKICNEIQKLKREHEKTNRNIWSDE